MDVETLKARYPALTQELLDQGRRQVEDAARQRVRDEMQTAYRHGTGRQGYDVAGLLLYLSLRRYPYMPRH